MKRIVFSSICIVIILTSTISMFAATPLKEFKVKIVDKNSVTIQNALITICPTGKPNDKDYRYFTTDANGEFRILSGDLGISVGEYNVIIKMPTLDKSKTETQKFKFTAENTKKIITIKTNLENQNQALFEAENRVDIYLRNSKDGIVRNMKIQLEPTFDIPQTAFTYGASTLQPFAYTNGNGRVTFVNVTAGEYKVEYSWLGGKSSGGKITIGNENKASEFILKFDETKLLKK